MQKGHKMKTEIELLTSTLSNILAVYVNDPNAAYQSYIFPNDKSFNMEKQIEKNP